MKKNLWILGGVLAMAFTACTNDDVLPADNTLASGKKVQVTAYAPGDGADSRIAFNNNGGTISLSWDTEESFSVIRGNENQTFSNVESGGNIFKGVLPKAGEGTYYAVYPANANAIDHTAVPYDLSVQTGAMNSNSTYMYASSETTGDATSFQFQHATAVLKATFSNTDWTADTKIKDVKVLLPEGKSKGTLDLTSGTLTGADNYLITINYAEPVAATTAAYIYLPPMAKDKKALYFIVTTSDEKVYTATLVGENNKDIKAGKVYTANVQVALPNHLIFVADRDGLSLGIRSGSRRPGEEEEEEETNLQYSTDGTNWTDLKYDDQVSFVKQKLFLRGTAVNGTNGARIEFGNNIKVACLGDIRTLMNYESYSTIQASGNFKSLFYRCTSLTTAPALPATTLAGECYLNMFSGCTSLTTAPALPATTLEDNCYSGMFSGCTSLTTSPALPATTLAEECYMYMFADCTLLNAAPALPATTLEYGCYADMFARCVSLTTAPALPATTLADRCYSGMFARCTSLNAAPPVLPATTLASMCYSGMFQNCTLLKAAPALPATTLEKNCYDSMFSGCTLLTTAPALPAENLAEQCYEGMFQGCTSLATAPTLPATTLAGNCYEGMFSGCISLTSAPVLPAENLVWRCYYEMFKDCTKLSSVTMLATNITATGCLNNWLNGAGTDESATPKTLYVASGMVDAVKAKCPDNWKDAVQVKP